jgi:hypothetical protein
VKEKKRTSLAFPLSEVFRYHIGFQRELLIIESNDLMRLLPTVSSPIFTARFEITPLDERADLKKSILINPMQALQGEPICLSHSRPGSLGNGATQIEQRALRLSTDTFKKINNL